MSTGLRKDCMTGCPNLRALADQHQGLGISHGIPRRRSPGIGNFVSRDRRGSRPGSRFLSNIDDRDCFVLRSICRHRWVRPSADVGVRRDRGVSAAITYRVQEHSLVGSWCIGRTRRIRLVSRAFDCRPWRSLMVADVLSDVRRRSSGVSLVASGLFKGIGQASPGSTVDGGFFSSHQAICAGGVSGGPRVRRQGRLRGQLRAS